MQKPHHCPEVLLSSGVWAEYVIKKYSQLILIPDELTFKQANLMEPVGDVVEAIGNLDLDFSSEILLIGAGFTGLVFLQLLRMRSARGITIVEPLVERRRLALQLCADHAFDSKSANLQMSLLSQTDFQGFDLAIDTSARQDILILPCPASPMAVLC